MVKENEIEKGTKAKKVKALKNAKRATVESTKKAKKREEYYGSDKGDTVIFGDRKNVAKYL